MEVPAWAKPVGSERYVRTDEGKGFGRLAEGSHGAVYPALDTVSRRIVAVKRQPLPSDSVTRELALYCLLRSEPHPNLQGALDMFYDYQVRMSYIVFEFQPRTVWQRFDSEEGHRFGSNTYW